MAVKYTEEQLNTVDKSLLIHLLLQQQEQLEVLTKELHASNEKMQLLMEQVILGKQNRFGRSSEKMDDTSQISFREVDGTIVFFNEAEAVCDLSASEPENLELKSSKQPKRKGKKEADLSGLAVKRIDHYLSDTELEAEFGINGWKQLPDAISKKYCISYLQRWKWKNITLVYMPAKQMNIWSRQTIRRPCCTEVWYPHLWQLQSSTENM